MAAHERTPGCCFSINGFTGCGRSSNMPGRSRAADGGRFCASWKNPQGRKPAGSIGPDTGFDAALKTYFGAISAFCRLCNGGAINTLPNTLSDVYNTMQKKSAARKHQGIPGHTEKTGKYGKPVNIKHIISNQQQSQQTIQTALLFIN